MQNNLSRLRQKWRRYSQLTLFQIMYCQAIHDTFINKWIGRGGGPFGDRRSFKGKKFFFFFFFKLHPNHIVAFELGSDNLDEIYNPHYTSK